MRNRATAVLFDLDSTLANTWHRQPMVDQIKAGRATWDDYSLACENDTPITGTRALMGVLWVHHQIHIISGRSAVAEEQTKWWLRRHGFQYDFLKLRAAEDRRPNEIGKIEYVASLSATVVLFVEDWKPTADKIEMQAGVPVLLVNPGYPELEQAPRLEAAQQRPGESSIG